MKGLEIDKVEFARIGKKITVCLISLKNGFELLGWSACVDADQYDEEIGKKMAQQDAENKLIEFKVVCEAEFRHLTQHIELNRSFEQPHIKL